MALRAVTFDKQKVKSQDDGLCHTLALMNKSCVIEGSSVSQDGASTVSIGTGSFFVCGRLVNITSVESLGVPSVPAGQTMYMRVIFEVNLNQANTETEFMQGSFKTLTSTTGYPALTQDDINSGGTLYQMPFIKLRADSTGIVSGSFADERTMIYSVATLKQDLDGKASTTHTHASYESSIASIYTSLSGKASTTHTHSSYETSIANINTALSGKSSTSHTHASLAGLTITDGVGDNTCKVVNVVIYSGTPPSAPLPNGTLYIKYIP